MPHAQVVLDGRYELHVLVGEGTFGRVYRGRDRRLGRAVAVKVIKPSWSDDADARQRFELEAQLLARVNDPGIVQIFDIGQAAEGLYYVAELVDGESLERRLASGPMGASQAREMALQICRALSRAHAEGIVHRDIKPANVLISTSGRVKLADFGVARLLGGGSTGDTVAGTPRYMAPEQARGRPVTPAADVYSVGVVLREMLATNAPASLRSVVERALAADPARRYADAGELAAALTRASVGSPRVREGTLVAPRLNPRRTFNPAARRRSIAALVSVAMLAIVMGVASLVLAAPGSVRLPDLRGLRQAAISQRMQPLSLHAVFSRRFDAAPAGVAVAQTPGGGGRVERDSIVRVVLSAGPPPVKVPRVVGQSAAPARTILASLGLSVRVSYVPAPGVTPGVVTAQSPSAGRYVSVNRAVTLSAAETPQWRTLTSFAGSGDGQSVAFRTRGTQWRLVYRMSFVGTCTWIFFCDGPSAHILSVRDGSTAAGFGLDDGASKTRVLSLGPGLYEVKVTRGGDGARWSVEVQDYY